MDDAKTKGQFTVASLLGYAPYLVFLACPLMMVGCFLSMRKMGCATDAKPADATADLRGMNSSEQVAALQAQLTRLQSEQAAIATQLADISTDEPREAQPAAARGATSVSPARA